MSREWRLYLNDMIEFSQRIVEFRNTHFKIYRRTKNASYLSFLHDLITLKTQKIATLKQYKKGLMQQLLPSGDEAS